MLAEATFSPEWDPAWFCFWRDVYTQHITHKKGADRSAPSLIDWLVGLLLAADRSRAAGAKCPILLVADEAEFGHA